MAKYVNEKDSAIPCQLYGLTIYKRDIIFQWQLPILPPYSHLVSSENNLSMYDLRHVWAYMQKKLYLLPAAIVDAVAKNFGMLVNLRYLT